MDHRKRLVDMLKKLNGTPMTLYQGIVESVEGVTCSCSFGSISISGIRLRASETENKHHMLEIPAVGSPVIVGSLSGDWSQLVVLQVDKVERIEINGQIIFAGTIVMNDGELGGLIKIDSLTEKLNALVESFNSHTHIVNTTGSSTAQTGTAKPPSSSAERFCKSDYEDNKITH